MILTGWKEIANYAHCGVRTVQRWERDLDLPIHRPKGKSRSAVLAIPEELDSWFRQTPRSVLGNEHPDSAWLKELTRRLRQLAPEIVAEHWRTVEVWLETSNR